MQVIFYFISLILIGTLWSVIADDVFRFENRVDNNNFDGLCPNNKTKCSSSGTCCKTKHNSYHCCRYKNAVCCPDLYHCCPHGSTCNTETKRCQRNVAEPMEWKVESNDDNDHEMTKLDTLWAPSASKPKLDDEPFCPNNKTRCKATKTCCITKHGNYYCCPHKNAVCCSDKWLCCAEGQTCDVKNKKCLDSKSVKKIETHAPSELESTSKVISVVEKFLGLFMKLGRHCGNSQKSCPGEKKCCAMTGDNFGCCKYRKGVCCPDFATCCPHDTQCDIKNKQCTAVPDSLVPAINFKIEIDTTCPDNKTTCSPSETCCSVGNVLYGCCPMKDAVCCSDKASCCPHDKKCDMKKRRCAAKDEVVDEETIKLQKVNIKIRKSLVSFLSKIGLTDTCPNNKDQCSSGQTCCPTGGNNYGCCPYAKGTCCSDLTSCCPNGTQCTVAGCV